MFDAIEMVSQTPASQPAASPGLAAVAQGAEATIYRTRLFGDQDVAIKQRLPKRYRIPELDEHLNRSRIIAEARALARAWSLPHVHVPAVYLVDPHRLRLVLEWIEGLSLRDWLRTRESVEGTTHIAAVLEQVGRMVAAIHAVGLIHGDLTTSNFIVRESADRNESTVFVIDFGLAQQYPIQSDTTVEAKAVDLYVLERALASVHVQQAAAYFAQVLRAYESGSSIENAKLVLRRLDVVRARGRKRAMIG